MNTGSTMTAPRSPRIDLIPGRTHRMTFNSFASMNLPGKRAEKLRLAFKLIWIAHRIFPVRYNQKGLRMTHYLQFKEDIENRLSEERNKEVVIKIERPDLEKTLRYMRKAGYMRYSPLEDLWYFSGKAAGTLRSLADQVDELQTPAKEKETAEEILSEFTIWI